MPPVPTSDKIDIYHGLTEKSRINYDYPLLKLKKMLISTENQFLDVAMELQLSKSLNLNSMQLTYLPTNFAQHMVNLSTLNLSHNNLGELPNSFHQLTKLEYLTIDNNKLASLPDSFVNLKHLRSLNVSNNELKKLPEGFGNLTNLEILDLSKNELEHLPVSCAMLNKLANLSLRENKFLEIPESVSSGMKNLSTLDVSNNKNIFMNRAPASIQLTSFIATNNSHCNYFPQWILWVKYSKLQEVILDGSNFRKFSCPRERIALQIKTLSMKESNLSDSVIDDIVCNMVKLEKLDLSNEKGSPMVFNNFLGLPMESMRVCGTLKNVNLRSAGLSSVSAKIGQFCSLVELDLSLNRITWLPEEFGLLQNLKVLRIERCTTIQLPDSFGELKSLEELWASNNGLNQLPESFFELDRLRVLDLYNNNILENPEGITNLNRLELLDLDQNFCDAKIHFVGKSYEEMKSALRKMVGNENRSSGPKEEDDTTDMESDSWKYRRYSGDSDDDSTFTEEEEQIENIEPKEEKTDKCEEEKEEEEEENWDISESTSDGFAPDENVGLFRSVTNYYISASSCTNYYCPGDDHAKPVRHVLAERNLYKYDTFEEGQFDDI